MENSFITKIEGHGTLDIDWSEGDVKLNIYEGERLFEGILVGRSASEMIWITPRICGVCPVAHNMASVGAVEKALGIEAGKSTLLLRDLLQCGQMIQSHVLHLFFLSLPDYLGIDCATELAVKNPGAFKKALALKELADLIVKVVGGRSVHPVTSVPGGFSKAPSSAGLKKILEKLDQTDEAAHWTADLCAGIKYPELTVEFDLVAQEDDSIIAVSSFDVDSEVKSQIDDYKKVIEEEVREYSTAKFGRHKGRVEFVGSLARLAVLGGYDQEKYKLNFANPFHNNIAQGVEVLEYHKRAKILVERLIEDGISLDVKKISRRVPLKGIGATEAPRGGLYHEVHLAKEGERLNKVISYANIITPTVQNLTSIEKSSRALMDQFKGLPKKEIERLMVMLVRAYDPCITCSVH